MHKRKWVRDGGFLYLESRLPSFAFCFRSDVRQSSFYDALTASDWRLVTKARSLLLMALLYLFRRLLATTKVNGTLEIRRRFLLLGMGRVLCFLLQLRLGPFCRVVRPGNWFGYIALRGVWLA